MRAFWNWISYIGVNQSVGFETSRRIILLNRIAILLFSIIFLLRTGVILFGVQSAAQSIGPYIAIFLILTIPYCNKRGYYTQISFFVSAVAPIMALVFSTYSQTTNTVVNINHYYMPRITLMGLMVLPLVLIDAKKKILLYSALAVNVACVLLYDKAVNLFGVPFNPATIDFSHHEVIAVIMLLPIGLTIMAFMFLTNLNHKYEDLIRGLNDDLTRKNLNLEQLNEEITSQRDLIAAKNDELEQFNEEITSQRDLIAAKNEELEQFNEEITSQRDTITVKNQLLETAHATIGAIHKDLTDSIMYAKNIQRAVLYNEHLPKGFFVDSFIYLKAKSHVSGDFYFYKEVEIDDEDCLAVAAVDCTGHGVPGGFLSMLGITLLSEILQNANVRNAADVLDILRERVKTTLNQTGKQLEQKDGMDMSLCIYHPKTRKIDYSGARNPLCIIDSAGVANIIKGDRQPIGVYIQETPFTNHTIQLTGGEMLYLFSDGLQDQFGGELGKKLKLSKLSSFFSTIASQSCDNQKLAVKELFLNWSHPTDNTRYDQVDDIVIIGMKIK